MTLIEKALKLAELLNTQPGLEPSVALEQLGFDEDDYFSEDDSVFDIDEAQNSIIDLSWEDGVSVTLRRTFKEWRLARKVYVWEVHANRRLTNYAEDTDFAASNRDGAVTFDASSIEADPMNAQRKGQ